MANSGGETVLEAGDSSSGVDFTTTTTTDTSTETHGDVPGIPVPFNGYAESVVENGTEGGLLSDVEEDQLVTVSGVANSAELGSYLASSVTTCQRSSSLVHCEAPSNLVFPYLAGPM